MTHRTPSYSWRRHWWLYLAVFLALVVIAGTQAYRASVSRKLEARLEAIKGEGSPASLRQLNEWYGTVPVQENAALLLSQAGAALVFDPKAREIQWPNRTEALPAELRADFTRTLMTNESALRLAHEAARLKGSRFPLDLTMGYELLMPHLIRMKQIVGCFRMEAALHSEDGRVEEAVSCLLDALAVSRCLEPEPVMVSQQVRRSCLGIARLGIERLLNQHRLSAASLLALQKALERAESEERRGLVRGIIGERCLAIDAFRMPPWKLSGFLDAAGGSGVSKNGLAALLTLREATGLADRDQLLYLETLGATLRAAVLPFPECLEESARVGKEFAAAAHPRGLYLLSSMLLPSHEEYLKQGAETCAQLRTARTAVAIQRYRLNDQRLPQTLSDLVPNYLLEVPYDPFDGKALRFVHLDQGYRVYSIGRNAYDDGALEAQRGRQSRKPRDIIFTVER